MTNSTNNIKSQTKQGTKKGTGTEHPNQTQKLKHGQKGKEQTKATTIKTREETRATTIKTENGKQNKKTTTKTTINNQ